MNNSTQQSATKLHSTQQSATKLHSTQQSATKQCSLIEDDSQVSEEICKIIDSMPSIDKMYILAYIIHDNSLKKKVFNAWKKTRTI
jgi:hypothetical protein